MHASTENWAVGAGLFTWSLANHAGEMQQLLQHNLCVLAGVLSMKLWNCLVCKLAAD